MNLIISLVSLLRRRFYNNYSFKNFGFLLASSFLVSSFSTDVKSSFSTDVYYYKPISTEC